MQSTWNRSPSARSVAPTTSATRPPMPASTSSKMSVFPRRVGHGQRLQREHDARQLAARHDPRERAQVLAGIGRDVELGRVDAALAPGVGRQLPGVEPHLEARAGHGQLGEQRLERLAEARGRLAPSLGQLPRQREEALGRGRQLPLQILGALASAR